MLPTLPRCDAMTRLVLRPYWQDSLATWCLRFDIAYAMWQQHPTGANEARLAVCAQAAYSFALDLLDYREE